MSDAVGEGDRRPKWRATAARALLVMTCLALLSCGDTRPHVAGRPTSTLTTTGLTFYRPSTALGSGRPGDLLEVSGTIPLDPQWAGTGRRIRYVSTTPAGDLVPVTGVVLVPHSAAPALGYPIVVWGHGTVGLGDPCAPSRHEPFQADGAKEFLAAGYVVVAPDYEGLGVEGETHPYLVGIATGNNILDAARVGARFGGGTRYVVFGASQGGHAALFARTLAAKYLPDMQLLGVVAAAPVTDPDTFLLPGRHDPNIFPFTAEAILAWSEVYEEPALEDLVVVKDAEAVRLAREEWCTGKLKPTRPLDDIFRADPQHLDVWRKAVAVNTPPADDLHIPVMLTHGGNDQIVPLSGTQQFHQQLCAGGEDAVLLTDPNWGHSQAWTAPLDKIVSWIADRFAGTPAPSDCD